MGLFPKDRDLTRVLREVVLPVRASDYQVRPRDLHVRLDAFLRRHLRWRSRNSIQQLIHDGFVLVDPARPDRPHGGGDPSVERRPGRRLLDGSSVVVRIPESLQIQAPEGTSAELVVLYEDPRVLAVDKPAGVTVHPSGRHLTDTLIQRVHARYARAEDEGHPDRVLKLCHRLDKETSGVVLVARERRAHALLMGQFERREVEKEYLAIVHGVPASDHGVIELPLAPSRTSRVHLKVAVAADGQPSRTSWRVLETGADCALLSCEPHTGRQHQIRVHLEAIGHPVVGDKLYGVSEDVFLRQAAGELSESDRRSLGLARHALHNHRLAFFHPVTGERTEVVSPLPPDMEDYLTAHRSRVHP